MKSETFFVRISFLIKSSDVFGCYLTVTVFGVCLCVKTRNRRQPARCYRLSTNSSSSS